MISPDRQRGDNLFEFMNQFWVCNFKWDSRWYCQRRFSWGWLLPAQYANHDEKNGIKKKGSVWRLLPCKVMGKVSRSGVDGTPQPNPGRFRIVTYTGYSMAGIFFWGW